MSRNANYRTRTTLNRKARCSARHHKPMLGYAGRFRMLKYKVIGLDEHGEQILGPAQEVAPWQDNLITDAGLNLLADAGDNMTYCRLGTNNTTPGFGDTALGTQVGSSNTIAPTGSARGFGADSTYCFRRLAYRFAAGTVSGHNLAEVGIGSTPTGTIFSHALLKDGASVPITITLAADEVLDVIYELRLYPSLSTVSTSAPIDGVTTAITIYPIGWGIDGTQPGKETGAPWMGRTFSIGGGLPCTAGSTANLYQCFVPLENAPPANPTVASGGMPTSFAWAPYVAGSFARNCVITLGLTLGNFATGIGGFKFNSSGGYYNGDASGHGVGQWGFTFNPKIQKDATKNMTITLGLTWGRYVP